MHLVLETSTEFSDAGIDAIFENVEFVVVGAIQHLLFDETPQPLDQVQVGRAGGRIKEFDPKRCGLVGDRLAFMVPRVVQHRIDRTSGTGRSALEQTRRNDRLSSNHPDFTFGSVRYQPVTDPDDDQRIGAALHSGQIAFGQDHLISARDDSASLQFLDRGFVQHRMV